MSLSHVSSLPHFFFLIKLFSLSVSLLLSFSSFLCLSASLSLCLSSSLSLSILFVFVSPSFFLSFSFSVGFYLSLSLRVFFFVKLRFWICWGYPLTKILDSNMSDQKQRQDVGTFLSWPRGLRQQMPLINFSIVRLTWTASKCWS